METISIQPIGKVRSPFKNLENMPIQPVGAKEVVGTLEIEPQFVNGLADLHGFSHIYIIYFFHKATRTELSVTPFMDNTTRGVFATRSPLRPSHIGLSIVELIGIENTIVKIRGVDVLDKTPLIDIKPYITSFDAVRKSSSGWMKGSIEEVANKRSDSRFTEKA